MDSTERKVEADSENVALHVNGADVGVRLDAYLASQIEGWSRSRLQRLIDEEDVLVNGHTAKSSYKVAKGDEIEVELTPAPSSNFTPENIPLNIVFEDEDLIYHRLPDSWPILRLEVTPVRCERFGLSLQNSPKPVDSALYCAPLRQRHSGFLVVATEAGHENPADQFAHEKFQSSVLWFTA